MIGAFSDLRARFASRKSQRALAATEAAFCLLGLGALGFFGVSRLRLGEEHSAAKDAIAKAQAQVVQLPKLLREETDLRGEKEAWEARVGGGDPAFDRELDVLLAASGAKLLDFREEKLGRKVPAGFKGAAYRIRVEGTYPSLLALLHLLPRRMPLAQPLQVDIRPGANAYEERLDMLVETYSREGIEPTPSSGDSKELEAALVAEAQVIGERFRFDPFFSTQLSGDSSGILYDPSRPMFDPTVRIRMQEALERGDPEGALEIFRLATSAPNAPEPPPEVVRLAELAQATIDFPKVVQVVSGVGVKPDDAAAIIDAKVYGVGESIDEETVVAAIDVEKVEFTFRGFTFVKPVGPQE